VGFALCGRTADAKAIEGDREEEEMAFGVCAGEYVFQSHGTVRLDRMLDLQVLESRASEETRCVRSMGSLLASLELPTRAPWGWPEGTCIIRTYRYGAPQHDRDRGRSGWSVEAVVGVGESALTFVLSGETEAMVSYEDGSLRLVQW
jgi:hypothetical protein